MQAFPASSVVALDRSTTDTRDSLLVLGEQGELVLLELERRENLLTGTVELDSRRHALPFERAVGDELPARIFLNEGADGACLVWDDGRLLRYDLRDPDAAALAQTTDVTPGDARVTAGAALLGKTTIVLGDSRGGVHAWFPVKRANASTIDGTELVRAHVLADAGPPIVRIASSARSRVIAAADEQGGVRLWNVTNERELARVELPGRSATALALAPKEDGLLAFDARGAAAWDLELRHPEAGLAALFRPVWYEGYSGPEHVWQSSSGTDSFEPKLGLVPLVFGTLKATFYSMLFAVPIALLAAVYTSQFLSARARAPIKAAVEMMASLPSVVLGFLAGVVVAPFVERVVPALLLACFAVPFALLVAAHVVQLLPERVARRVGGPARLARGFAAATAGHALALACGPWIARLLFAGDLRGWLDGRVGGAFGGWLVLLLPVAAAAVALTWTRAFEPRLRALSAQWERAAIARAEGGAFLVGAGAALGLAALFACGLQGLGLDARGGVFDTYVQRNALIVGAMMGFAVIPIVFTIADDALTAVPPHLKLASIGAGATPWQTAVRVVLPTAASGIFSAIMVGLGRAVGETMIVLMATGNTPVMSWNVFDGFRTLSANIAVELPEAVQGSTHYRTLFLAALCLFGLTFVLNTLAEVVRQRYRKRAARL
ncbi:MAG: ABC transporter permease subunit [Planctomycetes bacterium]|nr:ABC transporter permease subunit [Planctomycetota bacterium]